MLKKIGCTILMIALCFSVVGCDLGEKKVGTKQIQDDLAQNDVVVNCINSEFVKNNEFTFKKFEVIKRKTDLDSDIINCNVFAENEYFSVKLVTTLFYTFYDEGGWILDNLTVEHKEVTPLRPPEIDMAKVKIIDAFENIGKGREQWQRNDWKIEGWLSTFIDGNGCEEFSYHLQDFNFGDFVFNEESKTAQLNVSFKSSLTKVEGYFTFEISNASGWEWKVNEKSTQKNYPVFCVSNYEADYSEAIGKFNAYTYLLGNVTINVLEINSNEIKVEWTRRDYSTTVKTEVYSFDVFSGHFDGVDKNSSTSFYYNPNKKIWEEVNEGANRITSFNRIG